jgi:hypothetical protein
MSPNTLVVIIRNILIHIPDANSREYAEAQTFFTRGGRDGEPNRRPLQGREALMASHFGRKDSQQCSEEDTNWL